MARSVPGPDDLVRPVPVAWRVWFGLLGAPAAWAAHFLAIYGLIEAGCAAGWDHASLAGINGVAAAVILATLAAVPVVIAAGLVALRLSPRPQDGAPRDGNAHLRLAGMLLSGLFLLAVLCEALPVFVLRPCG